jgi:hypothetical protein
MVKVVFDFIKTFVSKYATNVKSISSNALGFAMANEVSIFLNIIILGLIVPILKIIFPPIKRLKDKKITISGTLIPVGEIIDSIIRFIFVTCLFYFILGILTNHVNDIPNLSQLQKLIK